MASVMFSPGATARMAPVSESTVALNLAMAMSCLDGKYIATVRGATSAAAAMSAMVVAW